MKICTVENDTFKAVAYKGINPDVIERHHNWTIIRKDEEKPIYIVFFIFSEEDKKYWRTNKLNNKFCIVYEHDHEKTEDWIKNFCAICYLK